MKIMMRSIIAVVLFLATVNVALATKPVIHVVGEKSFVLTINELSSDVSVSFIDKDGYGFYKQDVKVEELNYQKKFSVESLPNGVYDLEIEDATNIITLSVKIEDNKIVKEEIANEKVFKPVLFKKGENVYVSKFAANNEPLEVVIYNEDYDVVHEEVLHGDSKLGKIYKFKNSGDYTIALKSNEKIYEHTVSINK